MAIKRWSYGPAGSFIPGILFTGAAALNLVAGGGPSPILWWFMLLMGIAFLVGGEMFYRYMRRQGGS